MADFGSGLGTIIGGALADDHLSKGLDAVNGISDRFARTTEPYNAFGQSFLDPTTAAAGRVAGTAGNVKSYDDFMKDYTTSPAAKYLMTQADDVQNNSAAANGKLLSGSNMRALGTINEGIASTFANTAYDKYLAGSHEQFGQLNDALGNMFKAIGVGTTATGQQASVDTGQMNSNSYLAAAQAKNDQSKGSGFGSLFSGLGSFATAF